MTTSTPVKKYTCTPQHLYTYTGVHLYQEKAAPLPNSTEDKGHLVDTDDTALAQRKLYLYRPQCNLTELSVSVLCRSSLLPDSTCVQCDTRDSVTTRGTDTQGTVAQDNRDLSRIYIAF